MTTCDILLAHLCPLNNSSSPSLSRSSHSHSPPPPLPPPSALLLFLLVLFSRLPFSLSLFSFFPRSPVSPPPLTVLALSSYLPPLISSVVFLALPSARPRGLPPPRPTRKSRGEGTASEGSQRQLSKSCETGLDVYLLAQSAFISARVTRAVRYLLPWYVRKVSPVS